MEQNTALNPLGVESIPRLLLKYAIPSVVSMLVMSLYNIVDQIFIGHGVGYLGNAATTVAFPLVTMGLALALLTGNGAAAHISLELGRGSSAEAKRALGNALTMLLVLGLILTIGALLFLEPILRLLGATDSVLPYADDYMRIILYGMPFAMAGTAISNVIRADGSPRYSMVCILSGTVLNTILDPIFIFVFHQGVKGAAWATVISQVMSFGLVFYYILRKAKFVRISPADLKPKPALIGRIAGLGSSSFVNQIAIVLVTLVLNRSLTYYGAASTYGSDIPLAAMGIVMKINAILISLILGIAIGSQPILGFNYGAGNYARVKRTYCTEIMITLSLAALVNILFVLTPSTFVGVFGDESAEFNAFAGLALRTFMCCVFTAGVQIPSSSYFMAVGKPLKSMTLSMTRQVFALIPMLLILPLFFGLNGILYAGPTADMLSFFVTGFFILREIKHLSGPLKADKSEEFYMEAEHAPQGDGNL